jgi:Domain of unknown function (DUF4349)
MEAEMPLEKHFFAKLLLGAALILVIASLCIPNLHRSRAAADRASYMAGLVPKAEAAEAFSREKIIRTGSLSLRVSEPGTAASRIRELSEIFGGFVEKSSSGSKDQSGTLTVRIPAENLTAFLRQVKQVAIRVDREHLESRDATREYIDLDAQLRNARAEETQYLQIMRHAVSVKDTLEVSTKLADVRGRVEHLQGEMNYMTNQIAMSSIDISLWADENAGHLGTRWHPLYKVRKAFAETTAGLMDWTDAALAFGMKVPLILAWLLTIAGLLLLAWRTLLVIRRFLNSKPGRKILGLEPAAHGEP